MVLCQKVLKARYRRLRRLSKALLRQLRVVGVTKHTDLLRSRFSNAVARFNDLRGHPDLSNDDMLHINRVSLGLFALMEQIDATVNSRRTDEPEMREPNVRRDARSAGGHAS